MHSFLLLLVPALLALGSATAREADAAFQKHAWSKAVESYRKVTAETPEDGVAWYRLGISLIQLGQGADAVAPLEKARKLGVNSNLVDYQLAQAAALTGDKGRALALLEELCTEDYIPVGPPVPQEKAFASLAEEPRFRKACTDLELNRAPCKRGDPTSAYRQLDFWLGEWRVTDKAGNAVGTSHVEHILGGCALEETFHGQGGLEGRSLSSWSPGLRRWEHYWTDAEGVPIFFTGSFEEGQLRLRAEAATRRGVPLKWRLTLYKLPDGHVRQVGESSTDSGRRWVVQYDLTYVRAP